jgi:hypothetical protein
MTITIQRGEWEATISGDLEAAIRSALGEAGRAVYDAIDTETRRIHDDAVAAWPVRTGASKGLLSYRVAIRSDGVIVGYVRCDASYARYIQSWQLRTRQPRSPQDVERLRGLGIDPARQLAVVRQARRAGSRAAQSGSAMWLLLRWPEADAGKRLNAELGPLVTRGLRGSLA